MLAIGVALFVQSLAEHASALSGRLLIAILFIAAGAGRMWVEVRRGRRGREPGRRLRGRRGGQQPAPATARTPSTSGDRRARCPLAGDRETQHRLADPVHDRLLLAGERDLLLARRDRRPRARAHPARLPDLGGDVRADRDDLRRGGLASPGPRRRDGVRALRLQRAHQLRRGLGDPPRLRDPDRDHGVLRDAVPAGLLGPPRGHRRGARARARSSSPSSSSATSAASARGAPGASGSCWRATSRCRPSSSCWG